MAKRPKVAPPKPDFHRQTVLFQWALALLGVRELADFKRRYQLGPDNESGIDPRTGLHRFFEIIAGVLPTVADQRVIGIDRLREYEQNILAHTGAINVGRAKHGQPRIDWKYHQYLALLFTEMFLDRYFEDAAALRDEINGAIATHNGYAIDADKVSPFPTEPTAEDDADPRRQLSRLAFWCATGSGKTLLMHAHIHQFKHYHKRAFDAGKWPRLDQILLVTPNDGLSAQHQTEFTLSGMDAIAAGEQGADSLFAEDARKLIKVISIHKFQEEPGKATVATEAFEGCNLVLVDEGHRGAGRGEEGKWLSRRDQLAQGGFCIEYSATFKEAIGGDDRIRNRYARSILFDYAYRSFYRDGYGKDFMILNLEEDDKQRRYLTAALILFYQQLRVWAEGGEAMKPFLIDKPLWVFVGHTVTGGKVSTSDDKAVVTDVLDVLLFLKRFLADPGDSVALIHSLLTEGFKDHHGRDLLGNRLAHIDASGDKRSLAKTIHEGILRDVFNAPGGGTLAVQLMKDASGELALKVGESEPFGVVNVGDPTTVAQICEEHKIPRLEDDANRASLFRGINRDDSPINLLVGSRKFTEGWNSWRVSSIGLMRMGKSEGTQIIQLFGRGVRLRGHEMSLRRSSALSSTPTQPRNLRCVETLQVFGVKASYINTFRDWIYEEIPEAAVEKQIWDLPVVKTLPKRRLRTIRLKEEIDGVRVEKGKAFRTLGPLVRLRPPSETEPEDAWLRRNRTRLNWLPRVQGIVGAEKKITKEIGVVAEMPKQSLRSIPLCFFDIDALLFGVEAHKAAKGLTRLHVDRDCIIALLQSTLWYELLATDDDMRLNRWENRSHWQRMAQQLLNDYAVRFYEFTRSRWESPYIEVAEVAADDPNIVSEYLLETTEHADTPDKMAEIAKFVKDLTAALSQNPLADWARWQGRWRTVPFGGHLYQPLLHVGKNAEIRIAPVALNKDEAQFVEDLAKWCRENAGREVYLLRNQSRIGLGFFEAANYYPDFLLWVQDEDRQHLAFVDPKGLYHLDGADPKVMFATRDIPRLQAIVAKQAKDLILHAFLVCATEYVKLEWSDGNGKLMSKAAIESLCILFQKDDAVTYIGTMMAKILGSKAAGKGVA